jgi:hypothetical protein
MKTLLQLIKENPDNYSELIGKVVKTPTGAYGEVYKILNGVVVIDGDIFFDSWNKHIDRKGFFKADDLMVMDISSVIDIQQTHTFEPFKRYRFCGYWKNGCFNCYVSMIGEVQFVCTPENLKANLQKIIAHYRHTSRQ